MSIFMGSKGKKEDEALERMYHSDFEESDISGKNEELYNRYRDCFEKLKSGIEEIGFVSEQFDGMSEGIESSSVQVKHAVQFLADSAARQAEDIMLCKNVAEQLTERISVMDGKSKEMLAQVNDMEQQSSKGRENVSNLSVTQESVHQVLQTISEGIYEVLDKNKKIVSVTDMLNEIAKQTNLLSLNASIEAARAGEAGKGFAYVAYEVRKLSEECHAASENISTSVKDIMGALSKLKDIMDQSQAAFEAQKQAVNEAVGSFEKINGSVEEFVKTQNSFSEDFNSVNMDKEKLLEIMESISTVVSQASVSAENVAELADKQADSVDAMDQVSACLKKELAMMEQTTEQIKVRESGKKRKKVAMVWDLDDPFWYPAAKEAYRNAKLLNFDITVDAPKSRGEEGTLEMVNILEKVRDGNYDGICISPITDPRVEKLLQEIAANGTKIIFILSAMETVPYESLIGTNSYNCGRSTGEAVKKLMEGKGEAAIIKWKDNLIETVEDRYRGAMDVLKGTDIVVHNIIGPGEPSEQEAEQCIDSVLREHPNISMFCATNVGWGLAFARWKKNHHSNIRLVTVDFTDDVADLMKEEYIDAAIAQKPESWGGTTLQRMRDVFSGKKIEKVLDTGTYEVNPANMNIYAG